jgi:hypothetical protein
LFDPLAVPDELRERATAVVLTAPYHERDARRLGLPVHTPPADTWEDWVEKFGVDPDRVRGMEREDLAWLRAGEGEGHFDGPGAWPFGITAYAGREDNDLILWLPSINGIVTGDSLTDFGDGLDIQLGGRKHVTRDDVVRRLRTLLDLPVELETSSSGWRELAFAANWVIWAIFVAEMIFILSVAPEEVRRAVRYRLGSVANRRELLIAA